MTSRPIDLYRDAMQRVVDDVLIRIAAPKKDDWYTVGMREMQEAENAILFPSLLQGKEKK